MAEVLVNSAGAVLNNLGALIGKEIGLLWTLGDELEKLKKTVSTIRAVLHDAEKLSRTDEAAKEWLHDLKDVVYDVDDLLDDISTEVLRRQLKSGNVVIKEVRLFFSSSNKLAYGLKMAHKVKAIRERLDEIAGRRKNFHLNQNIVEQAFEMNHDRDTHSCAPPEPIGREDDKKKLVNSLLLDGHEKNFVVISIVGLGGLGKTTLAQMIYNDEKVTAHFDLRVWVCVSINFDVKTIVEKMIESIDKKKPNATLMEALNATLHVTVKGKKCLFVLDDIWNEERPKWVSLTDLIACVAPGSRILVTTRSKDVAKVTGALETYELEGLPPKESWNLFQQVAFNQGHFPNSEFEELGKEITKGCHGHPLTIRTIGSLLYTKNESDWRHFKDEEFSKLDTKDDILKTLKLSYNHLPSKLKPCFAYCSLFPEDHVFDVHRLISYWKAQGYVGSKTEGTSSQDDGLNCFKYLVQRSFFQIEKENEDGLTCRMHDLMHDLAMSVAGEEVKMLRYGSSDGATATGKTRHMSLHEVIGEVQVQHVAPLLQGKKARTLIFQCPYLFRDEIVGKECLGMIIDELRCLRVLSLQRLQFKKLPSFIDKLKHLRQLDLSENLIIEMLPDTVTRLHHLQELNMDGCERLKKLPRDMEKLVNLVLLGVKGCYDLEEMPRGIGKLTSLEVLSQFKLPNKRRHATGGLDELEKLNKLKWELTLSNLHRVKKGARECEVANLKDKPHLRSLTLDWGYSDEVEDMTNEEKSLEALQPHGNLRKLTLVDYRGARFPEWISFLQNLVKIKMVNCGNCKYLPSLDGLPSLKRLLVKELQRLEYMIDNSGNTKRADASCFFPSLETLFVYGCPELKGWWSTEEEWQSPEEQPGGERFPEWTSFLQNLVKIEMVNCGNCKYLPSLDWLPSLKRLYVERLESLEYMIDNSGNTKRADASCFFPSLEILIVWYCPELKRWWSTEEELWSTEEEWWSTEEQPPLHYSLPRLFELNINGCPNLKGWMPKLPSLKDLELEDVSMGLLEETLKKAKPPLTSTGTHVSPLQSLYIRDIIDLGVLHEDALQNLASLKSLDIHRTDTRALSPWLHHLTSLERLDIEDCEVTNLFEENNTELIQPLGLINLRFLQLFGCEKMKCLPRRFQYLTALEELQIHYCEELESMPTWVRNLTSLKRLDIFKCPLLSERCGSNQGEDWPSISHIPDIRVDITQIQLNGSYQL